MSSRVAYPRMTRIRLRRGYSEIFREQAARQVSRISQNEGRVKHGDSRLREMLRRAKERRGYNIDF